ncbi:hypothetical protein DMENIID0001_071450 [Sergentomyia squamirostris]
MKTRATSRVVLTAYQDKSEEATLDAVTLFQGEREDRQWHTCWLHVPHCIPETFFHQLRHAVANCQELIVVCCFLFGGKRA